MVSKVQICNIALSAYLGKQRINDIEEPQANAEQCRLHYDDTRRELLSEHRWSFATRRERLAELTINTRQEWGRAYAMPANAIRLNWVSDLEGYKGAVGCRKIEDTCRDVVDGVIYSDTDAAFAEILLDVDDPTVYPPKFVQAFAALLASKMAIPLTETSSKADNAMNAYTALLDEAKVQDINLEPPIQIIASYDWVGAR